MGDAHLPPALRRRSDVEAIWEDIEPYVGATVEERMEILEDLCRLAAEHLTARPDALAYEEPRSAESERLWLRLVAKARAR